MQISKIISIAITLTILTNCAVMSEEECAYSDWTAVGYEDGADGRSSDRFGDYRRACAEFGITPDFAAWQDGRERGLVEYCQPQRGFQVGQSGSSYNGVCSASLEPDFLEGYRLGSELFALRSNLNTILGRLEANANDIASIDADVADIESIIIVEDTTAEERAALLDEMRELSEIRGELEVEFEILIEERTLAEAALADFEFTLIDAGFY